MSIHAQLSDEAQAALAAQKRNSTISSLIIAILSLVLIGLVLFVISLTIELKEKPDIIAFNPGVSDEPTIEKPETSTEVSRKPSAPSSSMAKVIAANAVSPTAVPVPDVDVPDPSVAFGNGDDFGDGWGSGDGAGGGGAASFFDQQVSADRICFVIDYSMSMQGAPDKLMRKELSKSIQGLPSGVKYQMIFFAGPTWLASDDIEMPKDRKSALVTDVENKEYNWTGRGVGAWNMKGTRRQAPWIEANAQTIRESMTRVRNTDLIFGTTWENPLKMALDMDPAPQIIFFMTDGTVKGADQVASTIAARARTKNIQINTIAMMQPQAQEPLAKLAERTGGAFTIVESSTKRTEVIKAKSQ